MNRARKTLITIVICGLMIGLAWYAWKIPFLEVDTEYGQVPVGSFLSFEYLKNLLPLGVIILLSAVGIAISIKLRQSIIKNDPIMGRFADNRGTTEGKPAPGQSFFGFMTVRWGIMILASFLMIFGGTVLGLRFENITLPIFSCPVNTEQITEASCYYISHLTELFELPLKNILLFFASTIGSVLLLGRAICGFLCPMGLLQDITHGIRQKLKIEGIPFSDKMYDFLVPIKWTMVFLMLGLTFFVGNFCNFCPVIAVSPILAGIETSLYVSGFFMVLVIIGSFFKRRFFCLICPLGFLMGLLHKISPFRIKKDCTSCTECGACYEACPMGIKEIYTEREKSDVTSVNCIMCGECIRKCPEDKALCMTFAGMNLYEASRSKVMSGYKKKSRKVDNELKGLN